MASLSAPLIAFIAFFCLIDFIAGPAVRGLDTSSLVYLERHIISPFCDVLFQVSYLLAAALFVLTLVCFKVDRRLATRGLRRLLIVIFLLLFLIPASSRAREKPIIYLYPTAELRVNVKLGYEGDLSHTYPAYSEHGWDLLAKPSGELTDLRTGRTHYCLFWEGEDTHKYTLEEGFVVEGKQMATFLESALSDLGLSEREANEFIIYWLPRMEKNAFNLIHFATEEYDRRVPLLITPLPDTMIRVLMVFKALDEPVEITPQTLKHPVRQGFTVVEWGGTELR